MSKTILKLIPIFQEKIWGGNRLNTIYGYDIPSNRTGECWAISAHPNGDCTIGNPEFSGETLSTLWAKRPDLFGNLPVPAFPLLVKIIDAREDLSIQVHPDDDYANANENGSLGKSECWYILDCLPDTNIIIGHNAQTKQELVDMIEQKRWNELIREVPIHKNDFFQINPGCLHAIKKGTLILETQMSSDVTYRFYDYDRLENGKLRQLHIKESLEVTKVPSEDATPIPRIWEQDGATFTNLITCPHYSVCHVHLDGKTKIHWNQPFVNVSILSGEGTLDHQKVRKGDHLIITADYGDMILDGNLEFIYSHV